MKKRVSFILGFIFFGFMIVCTIFARPIHNYKLPKVVTEKVTSKPFSVDVILEDGTTVTTKQKKIAVLQEVVVDGFVYVLRTREHYGETEAYVEYIPIELGRVEGNYFEVMNGLSGNDKLIVESDRELTNGQTVLEVKD